MQHFYHHGDTICHIERLHVDAIIIYDLSARAIFTFPTVYVCRPRWPGRFQALAMHAKVSRWRQSWILNFCVKILLLPNYRVKYYDYIVKWCSGIVLLMQPTADSSLLLFISHSTCLQSSSLLFHTNASYQYVMVTFSQTITRYQLPAAAQSL